MGPLTQAMVGVGERLRAAGFPDRDPVLRALFVEGRAVPTADARAHLPGGAWTTRLVRDDEGQTAAAGRIHATEAGLLWADTPERQAMPHAVPATDAIDADICRALPEGRVRQHLDLGGGAGRVALHAARHARRLVALDPRPRCQLALRRTLALSGATHAEVQGLAPVDAAATGPCQRLSARLPVEDLELLPHVLHQDAIAVVWVEGAAADAVVETLHAAFGARPWAGRWRPGDGGGLLLLQADVGPAWGRVPEGAPLSGDTTRALLGG
jgi:hypothetical protein